MPLLPAPAQGCHGDQHEEEMMAVARLMILVASTRPGRVGLAVAQWRRRRALAHGAFEADFADLAAINPPFLDEPSHPRLRQYVH